MKTIAIVGSAGRQDDVAKMNDATFGIMCASARNIIQSLLVPHEQYAVVSGGAAWVDHIAVYLYNKGYARRLTLHLPCKLSCDYLMFVNNPKSANLDIEGKTVYTINHYHTLFSDITFCDTWESRRQICTALETGAEFTVSEGFFARNTLVARDADYIIAFTYGNQAKLKNGGTADTMRKFLMKKEPSNSYHVDLYDFGCYSPATV